MAQDWHQLAETTYWAGREMITPWLQHSDYLVTHKVGSQRSVWLPGEHWWVSGWLLPEWYKGQHQVFFYFAAVTIVGVAVRVRMCAHTCVCVCVYVCMFVCVCRHTYIYLDIFQVLCHINLLHCYKCYFKWFISWQLY